MRSDASQWCRTHRRQLVGRRLREVVLVVNGAGFEVDINDSLLLPDEPDSAPAPRILLLVDADLTVTALEPVD